MNMTTTCFMRVSLNKSIMCLFQNILRAKVSITYTLEVIVAKNKMSFHNANFVVLWVLF